MNVLDLDDLERISIKSSGRIQLTDNEQKKPNKTLTSEPGGSSGLNTDNFMPFG